MVTSEENVFAATVRRVAMPTLIAHADKPISVFQHGHRWPRKLCDKYSHASYVINTAASYVINTAM
jgi:hypothetical protein